MKQELLQLIEEKKITHRNIENELIRPQRKILNLFPQIDIIGSNNFFLH